MKKTYYWIVLIGLPLIPIMLNYFLPLGNMSNIGGDNSLVVWLNFWATFSNTLIYSAITLFVLYKQLKSNEQENKLNRLLISQQIADNNYNLIADASNDFLRLFDGTKIIKVYMNWLQGSKSKNECQNIVYDMKSELGNSWHKLNLLISPEDEEFRMKQEKNMHRLAELFDFYIGLFQVRGDGLITPEKLTETEYDDIFKYLKGKFSKIEILHDVIFEHIEFLQKFDDIRFYIIANQIRDYLNKKKTSTNEVTLKR